MDIKYFSDEQISDLLNNGFKLEPIIGPTIQKGYVAAIYANPENHDPILMDVFHTIEEVRNFDQRRIKARQAFSKEFNISFNED